MKSFGQIQRNVCLQSAHSPLTLTLYTQPPFALAPNVRNKSPNSGEETQRRIMLQVTYTSEQMSPENTFAGATIIRGNTR